jgi:hypothetical protein
MINNRKKPTNLLKKIMSRLTCELVCISKLVALLINCHEGSINCRHTRFLTKTIMKFLSDNLQVLLLMESLFVMGSELSTKVFK